MVTREDSSTEDKVRTGFGDRDPRAVHCGRQTTLRRGHAILDVDGRNAQIIASLESGVDRTGTIVTAGRAYVLHPLNAVDGFLQWEGDGGLYDASVGADVVAGDGNNWRCQLGIQRDRKRGNYHSAGKNNQQGANGCKYR